MKGFAPLPTSTKSFTPREEKQKKLDEEWEQRKARLIWLGFLGSLPCGALGFSSVLVGLAVEQFHLAHKSWTFSRGSEDSADLLVVHLGETRGGDAANICQKKMKMKGLLSSLFALEEQITTLLQPLGFLALLAPQSCMVRGRPVSACNCWPQTSARFQTVATWWGPIGLETLKHLVLRDLPAKKRSAFGVVFSEPKLRRRRRESELQRRLPGRHLGGEHGEVLRMHSERGVSVLRWFRWCSA